MPAQNATSIVEELEQEFDLQSWPDPLGEWFSTSTRRTHPGKKYHSSRHCRDLKTQALKTYSLPFSEVVDQICWTCTSRERSGALYTRPRLISWLKDLRALASKVDECTLLPLTKADLLTSLRSGVQRGAYHCGSALRCQEAIEQISTLACRTSDPDVARYTTVTAARLLERAVTTSGPSHLPPPRFSPRYKGDLLTSTELDRGWGAYLDALEQGEQPADASSRAAARISSYLRSHEPRLSQLRGVAVTATEGQVVTIDDLIAQWATSDGTQRVIAEVTDEWATQTLENVRASEEIGTLRVHLSPHARSEAVSQATSGRYPTEVAEHGELIAHVPAVVAVALTRPRNDKHVILAGESYPQDTLDIADKLSADAVPRLSALATAKTLMLGA